jgi:hypothetical protein
MLIIKLPFHQLLNEDHQHLQDKYNDEEVQVEHRYKQHDKAKKQNQQISSIIIQ